MSSPNIPEEKTEMSGSHASSKSQSFNGNSLSLEPLFLPSSGVPFRTGCLLGAICPAFDLLEGKNWAKCFPPVD